MEGHETSIFYKPVNEVVSRIVEAIAPGASPYVKVLDANGNETLVGRALLGSGDAAFRLPFDQHHPNYWLPDHVVMAGVVVTLLGVLGFLVKKNLSKDRPGGLQQLFELAVDGIRGLLHDVIGHHSERYLPVIGSFAFFIFFSNAAGLIFFLQPPTANMNTNLALALVSFCYYHAQGFKHAGVGYLKHFAGPMIALAPLFLILEPISHVARVLSLTLRLTGNIAGEHTATGVFTSIFAFGVPLPMLALGIVGTFMQTFIFTMLSSVYVAGAVAEEH